MASHTGSFLLRSAGSFRSKCPEQEAWRGPYSPFGIIDASCSPTLIMSTTENQPQFFPKKLRIGREVENLSANPDGASKMSTIGIDHLPNFLSPLAPSLQIADNNPAPNYPVQLGHITEASEQPRGGLAFKQDCSYCAEARGLSDPPFSCI